MKIIAIGGEPGAGKTSLVQRIIKSYNFVDKYNEYKLVPYLQYNNVYVLGKYDSDGYAQGTDRMSMAVQPAAVDFLNQIPKNSIVIFEGDRLFNSSYLTYCCKYDLDIIYLKTDSSIREQRYIERGSIQNKTWLSGRETKISNILSNLELIFNIKTFMNNTILEQNLVYEYIIEKVNNG